MSRRCVILLLACFPFAVSAAPVPPDDDVAKLLRAYGAWADPDKDCRYVLKEGELRVSLPKSEHVLGAEREEAKNNAPRVLREVEGDFTAVVRVAFPIPERIPKGFWTYCSGGLVAWESDKEYLVIRRCAGNVNDNREAIWSRFVSATVPNTLSVHVPANRAEPAYLRLKREGSKVVAGWSQDEKTWREFASENVTWKAKVKVGVVAENCLNDPVEIVFDQYTLILPKK